MFGGDCQTGREQWHSRVCLVMKRREKYSYAERTAGLSRRTRNPPRCHGPPGMAASACTLLSTTQQQGEWSLSSSPPARRALVAGGRLGVGRVLVNGCSAMGMALPATSSEVRGGGGAVVLDLVRGKLLAFARPREANRQSSQSGNSHLCSPLLIQLAILLLSACPCSNSSGETLPSTSAYHRCSSQQNSTRQQCATL